MTRNHPPLSSFCFFTQPQPQEKSMKNWNSLILHPASFQFKVLWATVCFGVSRRRVRICATRWGGWVPKIHAHILRVTDSNSVSCGQVTHYGDRSPADDRSSTGKFIDQNMKSKAWLMRNFVVSCKLIDKTLKKSTINFTAEIDPKWTCWLQLGPETPSWIQNGNYPLGFWPFNHCQLYVVHRNHLGHFLSFINQESGAFSTHSASLPQTE